ncbi:MAG: phosphoribosylformylglycinamidine cyclo-ligase [Eubacteriales bacterium]
MAIDYKSAGVDVEAGYEAVKLMKEHVAKTFDENVIGDIGSFGGLYQLPTGMSQPVLVSGTDGVGTKLKIAFAMDKHDTIGIDCVAMCANDIVCQGARPLFFLDYLATGKLEPQNAALIVKGISEGCVQAGCALIGGETAEMPGFYQEGEYDLAGFCVGMVDKSKIISGASIKEGDVLIGLASSGVHSNGFSLVRKVLGDDKASMNIYSDELGMTIGEQLLTPTKIYVKEVLEILSKYNIKGISHITGGGFIENIPRILSENLSAVIDIASYPVLPIFDMLVEKSGISMQSAYNTFNMGIGMVLCVDKNDAQGVAEMSGGYIMGEIAKGKKDVKLK